MFEAMSQFYAAVQDRQSPRKRLNGLKEKEVKQYDWKEGRWKRRKGTLKLSTSRSDEI